LATARVLVFVRWLLAATVPPRSATSPSVAGEASPRVLTAMTAPPMGRMAVCTMSHAESSHGILSAKNSTTYMIRAAPMIRSLLNTWNWGGRDTQP
jgi:hypothetical protein